MKSICRSLLLLLIVSIAFLFAGWVTPSTFAAAATPNKLEIARTPGANNSGNSSHEVVLRARLVQELYEHTLSLPAATAHQLCPMYLIANYQLTFLHDHSSVLHVDAVNGECQPVAFSKSDVRTADGTFWNLLNQAQAVGVKQDGGQMSSVPA
ncbi:MAG: hypothetical protein JO215_13230 [Ktedonobacteraceae bacterium]|nr:hypothetical protein [Ktedonobacteraceae bacterium]